MAAPLALVMAGGRGERMRSSGVDVAKPLVRVGGVPLLELNLRTLLRCRLREIVVSVADQDDDVAHYARERLTPKVAEAGGTLDLLVEPEPLGNIGAAGLLAARGRDVVVLFADNLTTLDLGDLTARHRAQRAALTLACHDHGVPIPYGRLVLAGSRVTGYDEKPTVSVPVASAVSVLAPQALAAMPTGRPTGLVDLTTALLGAGADVHAYRHATPWVDVNDASALPAAHALLAENPDLFPPLGAQV